MTRSRVRAGALAVLVGLAGACGPPDGAPGGPPTVHRVTIDALSFVPETLTVSVGDTVVWVNEDMVPHTVTGAGNGGPASGELGAQAEFRWVAGAAGRVAYRCAYHPVMVGEVMVD